MSKIAPEKIFVTTSEMTNILAVRRHDYDVEYVRKDIAAKYIIAQIREKVYKLPNYLGDIRRCDVNLILSELEKEYK